MRVHRLLMSAAVWTALGLTNLPIASAQNPASDRQTYRRMSGELLLENDRVVVQNFLVQPGESEGNHTHPGNQLLVYVKGGVWTSKATGRATLWKDGAVVWQDAVPRADDHAGSTNTGKTPIEMLWVTLKPASTTAATSPAKDLHVNYPNIPGEDLLENDLVIVQRFVVNPGEYEGIHEHPGNQLYVHIKDGKWDVRSNVPRPPRPANPPGAASRPAPRTSGGSIGWYPAHPLSEEHQSGNVGDAPIDLIWITLKQ